MSALSLHASTTVLSAWQVTGLSLPPTATLRFLCQLSQDYETNGERSTIERQISDSIFTPLRFGNDLLFWSNAAKFALQLLAGQHYLPVLLPQNATQLLAGWQPILSDTQVERQFEQLSAIMPPICRAYELSNVSDALPAPELLNHFVTTVLDATIRQWGQKRLPMMAPQSQAQQWLYSLLHEQHTLDLPPQAAHKVYQIWRSWSEQLHVTRDANFRVCFKLDPPPLTNAASAGVDDQPWTLHYFLQARDHLNLMLPATAVWEAKNHTLHLGSRLLDRPKERLLASLTIAARISPPIARSLQTPQPISVHLTTAEAYAFLNETASYWRAVALV
ncbi:MAG: hypothetical protein R2932_27055 [Caldilineaceae bacterium]